ncbi:MAG: ABC transporter permease [Planctomycetes bacterium]|nr:ABC transporter permease [Planctomycetota bacterium]
MTALRYILASLWHHRRVQLAVAAGVVVATAVITGALVVGDSVRGSLRELTLERLGRIEVMLMAAQPFRTALADEIAAQHAQQEAWHGEVVPLVLTRGTLKTTVAGQARLATKVSVVGCTKDFWQLGESWQLGPGGPETPLAEGQIAISRPLAEELDAQVGDELLLRIPAAGNLPGDSTLANKQDTIVARRFELAAILPADGLARFSLHPTQRLPRNVFLPLGAVQDLLDWQDSANALAVAQAAESPLSSRQFWDAVQAAPLKPTLQDLGLVVTPVTAGDPEQIVGTQITSRAMVLSDHVVQAAERLFAAAKPQAVVTYLANTIEIGGRKIPYSTITGLESSAALGPLFDAEGQPILVIDNEIVLNDWAADDLRAAVGDEVRVTYYEPETTHGNLREAQPLRLRLKAIVPHTRADGKPTRAADPTLTPELPGVTDQQSISDWDLPFELVETIRPQDEDYWDQHRTTPKAFVSLKLAEQLWHTRWGTVSALRLTSTDGERVRQELATAVDPAQLGMTWLPIKLQGLQAAGGTTSFEGLFLGFSFFLMASAVLLIALLFRLGIEGRTAEVGVLAAVGCSASRLRRLLLGEAAVIALVGAVVGMFAGVAYARLMIHGLSTWWVAATVTPFLELHVSPTSLVLGFAVGVIVALATTAQSLRKIVRLPVRQLLAGDCSDQADKFPAASNKRRPLPPALICAALALAVFATRLEGEAQAGAFFGGGALVLTGLLVWLGQRLRQADLAVPRSLSLARLAARSARRNPSRTILSVGLAAVASFLIVALSAFRLAPSEKGTGGYDLIATSDQPIHFDLNTTAGRDQLGFSHQDNRRLADVEVQSIRVHAGEDASCLNLYQTSQPRVLGVPSTMHANQQFAWAATNEETNVESEPWRALDKQLAEENGGREIVPIVLDKNTAAYSLHLSGIGARLTIRDGLDQEVTLEVVGLLAGSVLQGDVLMSEANFLRLFPNTEGHQLFLVKGSSLAADELSTLLESRLEDFGFDAVETRDRLADFMAVQNTYLSTFQSLGALGLLLGTFGLAVAQLRSVLERRGELALLRSTGFRRGRLAELVLGENLVLLVGGLGIGSLAAAVAVLPHWWLGEADTPWATLAAMLLTVALAGTLAGGLAVRAAVRAPIVAALRGE